MKTATKYQKFSSMRQKLHRKCDENDCDKIQRISTVNQLSINNKRRY